LAASELSAEIGADRGNNYIVEAAAQLFSKNGYNATSIEAILIP
jgi:AcrR family transcriptional regulator